MRYYRDVRIDPFNLRRWPITQEEAAILILAGEATAELDEVHDATYITLLPRPVRPHDQMVGVAVGDSRYNSVVRVDMVPPWGRKPGEGV
jgi:hypothetical protein